MRRTMAKLIVIVGDEANLVETLEQDLRRDGSPVTGVVNLQVMTRRETSR